MNELSDFAYWLVDIALWSLMWYFIIKAVVALYDGYHVIKDAKEMHASIADELDALIHDVKPEQHNDVMYWFDADTDRFLAQGKDIAEIRAHLKERFKQDVFMISDKILLVGPEYDPMDISKLSPEDVAKHIAETVVPKLIQKRSEA